MKQYWQKLAANIDARSLRERAIIFAMIALTLLSLVNRLLLEPQFAAQKREADALRQDQAVIAELQAQIQGKVHQSAIDPDAQNKLLLSRLTEQAQQLQDQLQAVQKGLIPADKMASVLEDILKRNGRLSLVSLRTLPPVSIARPADAATTDKNVSNAAAPEGALYAHGVEITVRGTFADMTAYLRELEQMPTQLFWSKAQLATDTYPYATLTLTVQTLSLDKKWLNI